MEIKPSIFDGQKVRDLRKTAGITQKQLAEGICSVKKLSEIENGKSAPPEEILQAIATRLGIPSKEFIFVEETVSVSTEEASEIKQEGESLNVVSDVQEVGAADSDRQTKGTSLSLEQMANCVSSMEVPKFERGRPYLSRSERGNYLFLNILLHKVDQIIEEAKMRDADSSQILMLSISSQLIAKAMAARFIQLDAKNFVQFDRETRLRDAALVYKSDASMHMRRYVEEDVRIRKKINQEMGGDPIHDLAEIVLVSHCRDCNGCPRHEMEEGCVIYDALQALQIEEWDPAHPQCGYAFAGRLEIDVGAQTSAGNAGVFA